MVRTYRDGTTSVGPQCRECGYPARWELDWKGGGAFSCGQHLNAVAPRDPYGVLLTPINPQRKPLEDL